MKRADGGALLTTDPKKSDLASLVSAQHRQWYLFPMSNSSEDGNKSEWGKLFDGTNALSQGLQVVVALAGIFVGIRSLIRQEPGSLLLAAALTVVGIGWTVGSAVWRRRRRKRIRIAISPKSTTAMLRGLLPFESGDMLLGRDADLGRLQTIVSNSEFYAGFLSGEAGAGKTSLLRAGLVPRLKAAGMDVRYLLRPSIDPFSDLMRGSLMSGETDPSMALARQAEEAPVRLVVVIDQFEAFFVASGRGPKRHQFFETLHTLHSIVTPGKLSFLLSLRHEFVDELLDASTAHPDLINLRWRYRLKSWEVPLALEVLRAASEHDNAPFAETLQSEVVRDLSRDDVVRPVELQLVATYLAEQHIFDVGAYRTAGGADGILKSYIQSVIAPRGNRTPETDRQLARLILRLLCPPKGDTRRPVGLTQSELTNAAIRQFNSVEGAGTQRADNVAVDRVLQRCIESFLVINESHDRFNLAHDYIVSAVRFATADVEPLQERADRLLEQYLEAGRWEPRFVIPLKQYRFVRRHSTPAALLQPASIALFRRSRRRYVLYASAAVIAMALLSLIIAPPKEQYRVKLYSAEVASWQVYDREFAISAEPGKELIAWDMSRPITARITIPGLHTGYVVSSSGRYVLGITPRGQLEISMPRSARPVWRTLLSGSGWKSKLRTDPRQLMGFSPNEQLAWSVTQSGDVFVWRAEQGLMPGQTPLARLKPIPWGNVGPIPPVIRLTNDWLIALDGDEDLHAIPVSPDTKETRRVLGSADHFGRSFMVFPEARIVAWARENRGRPASVWIWKFGADKPKQLGYPISREFSSEAPALFVSAGGEWMVGREFMCPFVTWHITDPNESMGKVSAGIPPYDSGSDSLSPVVYSGDGRWAAGFGNDKRLYVWRTATPQGYKAQPLFPGQYFGGSRPAVAFSADNTAAAAIAPDGGVHVWRLGKNPALDRPIGRVSPGGKAQFTKDTSHVLVYDIRNVFFGPVDGPLTSVTTLPSNVRAIATNPTSEELVVLAEKHITFVSRAWHVWGLAVWRLRWPDIPPLEPVELPDPEE